MDMMTIISTVARLIGTLSIWERVKYFINRKTNKRKEEAEADNAEFQVLREMITFLQEQLKEKEERFADQTARLRKTQDENYQLMREKAMLELSLEKNGHVKIDEGNNHEN